MRETPPYAKKPPAVHREVTNASRCLPRNGTPLKTASQRVQRRRPPAPRARRGESRILRVASQKKARTRVSHARVTVLLHACRSTEEKQEKLLRRVRIPECDARYKEPIGWKRRLLALPPPLLLRAAENSFGTPCGCMRCMHACVAMAWTDVTTRAWAFLAAAVDTAGRRCGIPRAAGRRNAREDRYADR